MNTKKEQPTLLAVLASVTAVLLCSPAGAAEGNGVPHARCRGEESSRTTAET